MTSVLDETSIKTSRPTGKARSPKVDLCVDGTTSVITSDERRRWQSVNANRLLCYSAAAGVSIICGLYSVLIQLSQWPSSRLLKTFQMFRMESYNPTGHDPLWLSPRLSVSPSSIETFPSLSICKFYFTFLSFKSILWTPRYRISNYP